MLLELWASGRRPPRSAGLGDSPNDLPMLEAVETPIVVPKPDTGHDATLVRSLPACRRAPLPGPRGWNHAVQAWLDALAIGGERRNSGADG